MNPDTIGLFVLFGVCCVWPGLLAGLFFHIGRHGLRETLGRLLPLPHIRRN